VVPADQGGDVMRADLLAETIAGLEEALAAVDAFKTAAGAASADHFVALAVARTALLGSVHDALMTQVAEATTRGAAPRTTAAGLLPDQRAGAAAVDRVLRQDRLRALLHPSADGLQRRGRHRPPCGGDAGLPVQHGEPGAFAGLRPDPAGAGGFVHALEPVPALTGFVVGTVSNAFGRLPDPVLLPWLPTFISRSAC
jgi:hypothetical protein